METKSTVFFYEVGFLSGSVLIYGMDFGNVSILKKVRAWIIQNAGK